MRILSTSEVSQRLIRAGCLHAWLYQRARELGDYELAARIKAAMLKRFVVLAIDLTGEVIITVEHPTYAFPRRARLRTSLRALCDVIELTGNAA